MLAALKTAENMLNLASKTSEQVNMENLENLENMQNIENMLNLVASKWTYISETFGKTVAGCLEHTSGGLLVTP